MAFDHKEPSAPAGPQQEIVLELGDFLPRIPSQLLNDQKPDPSTPLSFDIGELADRIDQPKGPRAG